MRPKLLFGLTRRKKKLPDLCSDASSNSWRPIQGFNAGPCFFVRSQEIRAACKSWDPVPDPESETGSNAASRISIGIRRYMWHSMPELHAGPGASLGIVTSMRDSMRDPASSHVARDSGWSWLPDPGPHPGPVAPPGIQCGTTYLDRDSEVHAAFYVGVPCRGPVPSSGSKLPCGIPCEILLLRT